MKRDINAKLLVLFATSVIKKKVISEQCYTKAAMTHELTEEAV